MNINFANEYELVEIKNIAVGSSFMTTRTKCNTDGVYMKIDANNTYVRNLSSNCYAVNLVTGQIREFMQNYRVTPITADVIIT